MREAANAKQFAGKLEAIDPATLSADHALDREYLDPRDG